MGKLGYYELQTKISARSSLLTEILASTMGANTMPATSGSASSLIFASSAAAAAVFAAYRIYRWSAGRNREAEDHR